MPVVASSAKIASHKCYSIGEASPLQRIHEFDCHCGHMQIVRRVVLSGPGEFRGGGVEELLSTSSAPLCKANKGTICSNDARLVGVYIYVPFSRLWSVLPVLSSEYERKSRESVGEGHLRGQDNPAFDEVVVLPDGGHPLVAAQAEPFTVSLIT